MKIFYRALFVSSLILLSGCASHALTGYNYGYHGGVSVGVHGNGGAAAVLGALIVGGAIGSIITDAENKKQQQQQQNSEQTVAEQNSGSQDELVNGYSIETTQKTTQTETEIKPKSIANTPPIDPALKNYNPDIKWYQYGKDSNCYLMGIDKGVTDIISVVATEKCGG